MNNYKYYSYAIFFHLTLRKHLKLNYLIIFHDSVISYKTNNISQKKLLFSVYNSKKIELSPNSFKI